MGKYRIEISRSAEKVLARLPKQVIPRIVAAIQNLAVDPRPFGCRKLTGQKNVFRIRVQVYRILYEIHDELILIQVLKIGHRKDVYQ